MVRPAVQLPPAPDFDRPLADLIERAAAAGLDPVHLRERLGDRAPLLHLTDHDGETGDRVTLGSGDLDLAACAEAHAAEGGAWLVHEHAWRSAPDDPVGVDGALAEAAGLIGASR